MNTHNLRVILCDDDPLARSTLTTYLSTAPDITLLSSHENAAEAIEDVENRRPDVLLTDIRMPGFSGIEMARRLARHRTRVLLITSYDDDNTLLALQAGAAGYVLKSVTPSALNNAIRAVAQGLMVISAGAMAECILPASTRATSAAASVELSAPERDVLRLLCQGRSNAEMAQQLYLSVSTVKRNLASAMRKLGTTSRLTTVLEAQHLKLD